MKPFNFSNFTQQLLDRAMSIASQDRCQNTTVHHLLYVLLNVFPNQVPPGAIGKWRTSLERKMIRLPRLTDFRSKTEYDKLLKKCFELADRIRVKEHDTLIHPKHLWEVLVEGEDHLVNMDKLDEETAKTPVPENREAVVESSHEVPDSSILSRLCINFTQKAKMGALDPVVGREREIRQVVRILLKRKKNNPLLLGEAGVGKTAIVEGISQQLVDNIDNPLLRYLKDREILGLDLMSLIGGTGVRGELENRLKELVKELEKNGHRYILFIDEIHNLMGAGKSEGSGDLANYLKPAIARGEVCVIGATTFAEYKRFIEPDAAFKRRLEPVLIEEPSFEETKRILQRLQTLDEEFHHVTYLPEVIEKIPLWATNYFSETRRPDSAINLMDNLGAYAAQEAELARSQETQGKPSPPKGTVQDKKNEEAQEGKNVDRPKAVITLDLSAQFIHSARAIDKDSILFEANDRIAHIKTALAPAFRGQEKALDSVFKALASLGIPGYPRKRVFPLLFVGPGDSEKMTAAYAVAEYLYPVTQKIYTVDMAAYVDRESLYTLIGPPRGIEGFQDGGEMTEFVKRNPQCCLVLTNAEHAHSNVMRIFLEPLRWGTVTDNARIPYPLHQAMMIVLTDSLERLQRKHGSEFVDLIPNKIYFDEPGEEVEVLLLKDMMPKVTEIFEGTGYTLDIPDEIYPWLQKAMESDEFEKVSRQALQDAMKVLLEDPLSAYILEKSPKPGKIRMRLEKNELKFYAQGEEMPEIVPDPEPEKKAENDQATKAETDEAKPSEPPSPNPS